MDKAPTFIRCNIGLLSWCLLKKRNVKREIPGPNHRDLRMLQPCMKSSNAKSAGWNFLHGTDQRLDFFTMNNTGDVVLSGLPSMRDVSY